MREKKFRYTFKHVETGNIEQKIYTLSQLEERNAKELSPCFNAEFGYELIGRDDFTGLKDKNGKEIYEGDVLEIAGCGSPLRCVIEYKAPSFCRRWIDKVSKRCRTEVEQMAWNTHIVYEVIGNIYEHSHLLEVTE